MSFNLNDYDDDKIYMACLQRLEIFSNFPCDLKFAGFITFVDNLGNDFSNIVKIIVIRPYRFFSHFKKTNIQSTVSSSIYFLPELVFYG